MRQRVCTMCWYFSNVCWNARDRNYLQVKFYSIVNIQINEKPKSISVGSGSKGQRYDRSLYSRTIATSYSSHTPSQLPSYITTFMSASPKQFTNYTLTHSHTHAQIQAIQFVLWAFESNTNVEHRISYVYYTNFVRRGVLKITAQSI